MDNKQIYHVKMVVSAMENKQDKGIKSGGMGVLFCVKRGEQSSLIRSILSAHLNEGREQD